MRGMYPPSGLKASSFGSSSSCPEDTADLSPQGDAGGAGALTSTFTITKLWASSEISFDSANLGFRAERRDRNKRVSGTPLRHDLSLSAARLGGGGLGLTHPVVPMVHFRSLLLIYCTPLLTLGPPI